MSEARYFTGEPCCHGHIAERRSKDGYCVACRSAGTVVWRRNNAAEVNRKKLERRKRAYLALRALEELGIKI